MIAHLAAAHEGRGRVIVRLGEPVPSSPAVLAAAAHVARAFGSAIEGLFIEDVDTFVAATHPSPNEVSLFGNQRRKLEPQRLQHDVGHFGVAIQRQLSQAAAKSGVAFEANVVRGDVLTALTQACDARGPWNMIALGEPIATSTNAALLSAVAEHIVATTGVIAAGRSAQWRSGPIVIALEDVTVLAGLVRAAQRMAAPFDDPVWLLPVGEDAIALDWLDSEIRLTMAGGTGVQLLAPVARNANRRAISMAIAACQPRLVLARMGGLVVPSDDAIAALSAIKAPVFLAR
jgi:hypothetical protein